MIRAVDYFTPLSTPDQALQIKLQGHTAIARYLGTKNHPDWGKGMTLDEVKYATSAGLKIISIWEGNSTSVGYFTKEQGTQDGQQALDEAKTIGQPTDTAIYFAVDFNAVDADMNAVRDYLDAVKAALGGVYKLGVYGSYEVMSNVAADFYWQTAAWSGGKLSPRACMYQDQFDQHVHNIPADVDEIYHNPGWWPVPVQHYVAVTGWFDNPQDAANAAAQITANFGWHSWPKKGDD